MPILNVPFLPLVWIAESNVPSSQLGSSVGSAGDVNGDGYDDVIVGAPIQDGFHGSASVYLGTGTGLEATEAWAFTSDVDATVGRSVATAGDVNGDGYDDVIVGAPAYPSLYEANGQVFVFHGSPSGLEVTPAWSDEGQQRDAQLGWSVSTAGDVNGDGFDDIIVGAPFLYSSEDDAGFARAYDGSTTGVSGEFAWRVSGSDENSEFGESVSFAGDVNADGYDDVVVGAPSHDDGPYDYAGRATTFLGSATGLGTSVIWDAQGEADYSEFGSAVSSAGDVNGDGFDDVVVGAYNWDGSLGFSQGRAYLYIGSATGLEESAAWIGESDQAGSNFGSGVAGGDVNADGYSDVVIGAGDWDDTYTEKVGRIFLFLGSSTGPTGTPAWTAESSVEEAGMGWGLGIADVNADGSLDIVAGAPTYTNGEFWEGAAFLFVVMCKCYDDAGVCADEPDPDGDAIGDVCDLCPKVADPDQEDADGDAIGDACDPCPLGGSDADADGHCSIVDCDDGDPTIFPGAPEECDGVDGSCAGEIPVDERDEDGDGASVCAGDCADADPTRFPSALELCNDIDDDCDGGLGPAEMDADGDQVTPCDGDCNDANTLVNATLIEVCGDRIDNNCDGAVDDACTAAENTGCGGCDGTGAATWPGIAALLGAAVGLRRRVRPRSPQPSA